MIDETVDAIMTYSMGPFLNLAIGVSGVGSITEFTALMTDTLPDVGAVDCGQWFPLWLYEPVKNLAQVDMFGGPALATGTDGNWIYNLDGDPLERRDAITDEGLRHFQEPYPGAAINRFDVFFYVYGILHSPDYRTRYSANLGRELPRIPRVASVEDFWAFSQAGRQLALLHTCYDAVPMFAGCQIETTGAGALEANDYRVKKMRYGKGGDRTVVRYNERITVTGIPLEAHEYVVTGRSAIDWVVTMQGVRTDKDSGIVSDANDWAADTLDNPQYPLELLLRVITVSLDTLKIVRALPPLSFYQQEAA